MLVTLQDRAQVCPSNRPTQRRGIILLVVLAMLTLLAIMGISFVMYANSQAEAARIGVEAENLNPSGTTYLPAMDPNVAFNFFLSQLIYDVKDDANGVYSGMRGHSFSRTMYGDHPSIIQDKPFTGSGRLHNSISIAGATADEFNLINYTFFPSDNLIRHPDYQGTQAGNVAATPPSPSIGNYLGQLNVPYTYPDVHNMALAMFRASDGKVLLPSFHRPWVFGSMQTNNGNWNNGVGKYLTLRPRPADHTGGFPYTEDSAGDVKNWISAPGGMDSIWMDLGAPILLLPDGKKYKALFAPLVIDLDGRINLNTAGNIVGTGNTHGSNQGWGPWEVNFYKLANGNATIAAELKNIFLGNPPTGSATTPGRYGSGRLPIGAAVTSGTGSRPWAPVDYNGIVEPYGGGATGIYYMPGTNGHVPYTMFPLFPTNGYNNGVPAETTIDGTPTGTPIHPSIFNALRPASGNFAISFPTPAYQSMATLLRWDADYQDVPSDASYSDIRKLCPQTFGLSTPTAAVPTPRKYRKLATTISMDLDRPGLTPYIWDPAGSDGSTVYGSGAWGGGGAGVASYPKAGPVPFPALASLAGTPLATGEFDASTRRSKLHQTLALLSPYAQTGKLDLNRTLAAYPAADGTTGAMDNSGGLVTKALQDRQNFAKDIFNVLKTVTGCPAADDGATGPHYQANRYLAQLAVNIVDYIDQDDYSTPFNWTATDYVFGVELPRLVINETYSQIDNDKDDTFSGNTKATTFYNVSSWVELHNPFIDDSGNSTFGNGYNRNDTKAILQDGSGNALYRILICNENISTALQDARNTAGDPQFDTTTGTVVANKNIRSVMQSWTKTPTADPTSLVVNPASSAPTSYQDAAQSNTGFYVVGPSPTIFTGGTDPTSLPVKLTSSNMSFSVSVGNLGAYNGNADEGGAGTKPWPTIVLQRLACPGLPYNNTPGNALYNPYITIDYVENNNDQYINEARTYNKSAQIMAYDATTNPNGRKPVTARNSWGRNQPYAAAVSQRKSMNPSGGSGTQPLNTFYRHNAVEAAGTAPVAGAAGQTLQLPFDWLTFLDRQLISPIELFSVPAVKPDQLTQRFAMNGGGGPQAQVPILAPFLPDQDARLHRLLEVVQVKPRGRGVAQGGRVPGRININSIWDPEVFRAIADAQPGNRFRYQADGTTDAGDTLVDTVSNSLLLDRSPTAANDGGGGQMPGQNDRPIWSLSLGHATNSGDPMSPVGPAADTDRGQRHTLLRTAGGATAPWFDPYPTPGTIPIYQHQELLTKVFSRLTTRSNVFAVWVTVGFFEVMDDTVKPVKLGAEIGRADGKNIRRRMFALIDRTNLTAFQATVNNLTPAYDATGRPTAQAVTLSTYTDSTTGNSWTVTPGASGSWSIVDSRTGRTLNVGDGTLLVLDPDTDTEETVMLVGGQVTVTQAHTTGKVSCRGNPGPWKYSDPSATPGPLTTFDPAKDPGVVLYSAVIE